jgi:3-keto-5-aminohexanoate cleavage enzyme
LRIANKNSQSENVPSPAIITVAITGSVPRKSDTPAVPVTPSEQIESTHEAFEAGASLVHIHVRNPDESPSSSPELFAKVQEGIVKHCPGMIVQFSTGGRGRTRSERAMALDLRPDMASLSTGSCNFTNWIFENPPDFVDQLAQIMKDNAIKPEIEVFDVSMLYSARSLAERGLIARPLHVQFVMGVQNALPVRRPLLEFLVSELRALEPNATWAAIGLGRHQLEVNRWSLELGGHVRTGLEDNIKFDRERLAKSNAELVARVASMTAEFDRRPATPAEARAILGLAA